MIDPAHYGLVELALSGAIVLAFLFWQLWTVRHVKLGDPPKPEKPEDSEKKDPPA